MDVIFTHGAGVDVHQKRMTACRVPPDPIAQQADGLLERRDVGTMTADWLALSAWLAAAGVTPVAMERTGEDWKPVFNIWDGSLTVFLVNAAPVKQGPGRKTDTADARWLATRMHAGLLQASFMPPAGQRHRRDLTRSRTTLGQERGREVNRVHGGLARATIRLAAVATHICGVAGRAEPATTAELAQGRRRSKVPLLEQALTGLVRAHHRRLLTIQWAHLDCLDEQSEALSAELTGVLTDLRGGEPPSPLANPSPPAEPVATPAPPQPPWTVARAVSRRDMLPGVTQRGAALLVAEWGIDMTRVGSAARLSAWRGVAPGNDESTGNPRSGKTRKGNRALRAGLTPLAHAAARPKETSLSAVSHRLAARRGKQRAIRAVAHAIVVSAFSMLSRNEPYRALGANDCDEHRRHQLVDRLARRIERLGSQVSLQPVTAA